MLFRSLWILIASALTIVQMLCFQGLAAAATADQHHRAQPQQPEARRLRDTVDDRRVTRGSVVVMRVVGLVIPTEDQVASGAQLFGPDDRLGGPGAVQPLAGLG